MNFTIDKNISRSRTLPARFYRDESVFETLKEKVFARSWLYVADDTVVPEPKSQWPFTLLEHILDEPLVLCRDKENKLRCLSNVCTHRGKIIVEEPQVGNMLRCGYHGRCFRLDGSFKSTPGFEGAEGFPTADDNLHNVPLSEAMRLLFVSLDPAYTFEELMAPIMERVGWIPSDTWEYTASGSKDYFVNTNWALYCDNYLEGFHIPFVHPALNNAIEPGGYEYEIFPYANLQTAYAADNEPAFDLPESSPDYGKRVYAYYFWVFPNMMFNFYPWGLSLNIVIPLSQNKTKVSFRSYIFKDTPFDINANQLDLTEMEDEAVVESVQKGMQSRFYKYGRFSPKEEKGVHHFHSLLADFMGRS